ncbi:hypothetical protein B0H14DRAFT_2619341 [Mycena olivaceomarginata]|nr:hypothetical protein B0H14DRAFT_2619341 [Mycena olivaceomarginata]
MTGRNEVDARDLIPPDMRMSRTRISHAGMLSIDELLDPPDEREIGQALYALPAEEAVARGDVMDVDEDGDQSDAEEAPEFTCKAIMDLGRTLEENLQQFRGQIQKEQTTNAKQAPSISRKLNNLFSLTALGVYDGDFMKFPDGIAPVTLAGGTNTRSCMNPPCSMVQWV